mmetsp:Transcript_19538/g.77724  ORF Transcript_19538/g.77724 Transcript_19538/m.77724 type:complete len:101 (+) Transcript_19538:60-362(+)
MAFRFSVRRLAGAVKPGVQPHLELWWKKKPADGVLDGLVQQSISPFELKPIRSLIEQFSPANFMNNFPSLWDVGPALVFLVGTIWGGDAYFEYLAHLHRD